MNRIQIYFEDIPSLNVNKSIIEKQINFLISKEFRKAGKIAVIFCSDNYLLQINKQYLKHNYYTDIITFNYSENLHISGDLFISIDRVKENAGIYNCTFQKELYRVIFHGVLHLIGYNDKTDDEKNKMRAKENYYLSEVDFGGNEL